jgi:anti-anti-sigma factor
MLINLLNTEKSTKDKNDYDELVYLIKAAEVLDTGGDEEMYILLQTIINAGAKKIIINMENMNFIDSKGIAVLINAAKVIRKNNGDIVLFDVPERIKSIFRPINLQRFIKIFDTEEQAVKELKTMI